MEAGYEDFKKEVKSKFIEFCRGKITQTTLARVFNLKQPTVGRWWDMSCDALPPLGVLYWLARHLELDLNDLLCVNKFYRISDSDSTTLHVALGTKTGERFIQQRKPTEENPLTEEDVRRIIKEELFKNASEK